MNQKNPPKNNAASSKNKNGVPAKAAKPKRPLAEVLEEAYEALYSGDFDLANSNLDEARRIDSNNRDVVLLEIDLFVEQEAYEEAISAAEEAVEQFPDDMVINFKMATLYLDIDDDVASATPYLDILQKRIAKGDKPTFDDPEEQESFIVEVLLTLVDCAIADRRLKDAKQLANDVKKRAPQDPAAALAVATALFEDFQFVDAKAAIKDALALDEGLAEAYWLEGRISYLMGDDEKARPAFARAARLDENYKAPKANNTVKWDDILKKAVQELPNGVQKLLQKVELRWEAAPSAELRASLLPQLSPSDWAAYVLDKTKIDAKQSAPSLGKALTSVVLFQRPLTMASNNDAEYIENASAAIMIELSKIFDATDADWDELDAFIRSDVL